MKPALLCLLIAAIACTTPEERLEELEQDFNELGDDATWEEVGEILDEAAELAHRPASREALRDARRELEELTAVWDDVLLHSAEAEEVIEREGYLPVVSLESNTRLRDRLLAQHDEAIAQGSAATVASTRQQIPGHIDMARWRIETAQEILGRPAREAARIDQALRDLAELERIFEAFNARDPANNPLDRWDLDDVRSKLDRGDRNQVGGAANWIARNLDSLRAAVTTEP